jgi:Domain of unknown function (DUF4190)
MTMQPPPRPGEFRDALLNLVSPVSRPPSPPWQQPPPWQLPPWAYYPPPRPPARTSGLAVASLVLGIVGLVLWWLTFGVAALLAVVFGHVGLSQTRRGDRGGRGMAVAGLSMGYVGLAAALVFVIVLAVAAAGSGTPAP